MGIAIVDAESRMVFVPLLAGCKIISFAFIGKSDT